MIDMIIDATEGDCNELCQAQVSLSRPKNLHSRVCIVGFAAVMLRTSYCFDLRRWERRPMMNLIIDATEGDCNELCQFTGCSVLKNFMCSVKSVRT